MQKFESYTYCFKTIIEAQEIEKILRHLGIKAEAMRNEKADNDKTNPYKYKVIMYTPKEVIYED